MDELIVCFLAVLLGGELGLAVGIGKILKALSQQETVNPPTMKIGFHEQLKLDEEEEDE